MADEYPKKMSSKKSELFSGQCKSSVEPGQTIEVVNLETSPNVRYSTDKGGNLIEIDPENKQLKPVSPGFTLATFKVPMLNFCSHPCARIHSFKEQTPRSNVSLFVNTINSILNASSSAADFNFFRHDQDHPENKLDKKRLTSTLNKFKSNVVNYQSEYGKHVSQVKKKLRQASDELINDFAQSRNQLLDLLNLWEIECLVDLESTELDNWKKTLTAFEAEASEQLADADLDEMVRQVDVKHREFNELVASRARIKLERCQVDSDAAFLLCSEISK